MDESSGNQVSQSRVNRLILIDGNAVLHRAYHALPPLTGPDGSVVNAVYGFTSMLIKLFGDLRPSYIAVAFDRPKPTFRKEMFAHYQAHRPKMDDDLVEQIGKVHEVITAFGIPIFEVDGYEADDVIGTLTNKLSAVSSQPSAKKIDQIIIVTGDRDILQLVEDERVLVYMPTKGISEAKLYGEAETKERMGVTPKQIPDFKALAGDNSDNYPGVAGIGPKTAVSLLATFGEVKEIYKALKKNDKRIQELSEGVRQKLLAGEESAEMSHDLATIRLDVPLDGEILDHPIKSLDIPSSREILNKYQFHTLFKRLTGEVVTRPKKTKAPKEEKKDKGEQQQLF